MLNSEMLVGCVIVIGVITATAVSTRKPIDAEVTAAHVREATERKQDVRPEDFTRMRHPIALELCSATMGSGYHAHKMKRSDERCYMAKGRQ